MDIPHDKLLHAAAGNIAAGAACVAQAVAFGAPTWWAALGAAAAAGVTKELWDSAHPGHAVDPWDAVATIAGALPLAAATLG